MSDAELALLVSRSQSVARSAALTDAPLSESALLAVVNALDDVSPVLSRPDVTPRVLAAACERVDADGARRVARRGNADGVVAAGLARNPWPSVRAIAARLADLPADVVDKLAADGSVEVRDALAARADLPREAVRRLWEGALPGSWMRERLSKNECVSAEWMVAYAGEMRAHELRNVLSRDSDGVDELIEVVARNGCVEARCFLAGWVGVSDECARILSGDVSWEVRRALAGNVSAPHAVLEALAADADARVAQSAEVSQAYVRDHNGDDAALYPVLAERDTRGRAERGTRGRFGSNYSEIPNSYPHRGVTQDWTGSRDGGAHG